MRASELARLTDALQDATHGRAAAQDALHAIAQNRSPDGTYHPAQSALQDPINPRQPTEGMSRDTEGMSRVCISHDKSEALHSAEGARGALQAAQDAREVAEVQSAAQAAEARATHVMPG